MVDKEGLTYAQAKSELGDIDSFCHQVCNCCTANDWYCPTYCTDLEKARRMDFDRIIKCYARHDGDLAKVMRYIKNAKVQVNDNG